MKKKFPLLVLIILILIIVAISGAYKKLFIPKEPVDYAGDMEIASSRFYNNGEVPERHTCEGEDINPYLKISKIPAEAKTLVLIVDDPDAKKVAGKIWAHWLIFNIPVAGPEIEIQEDSIPGIQGTNDFKKLEYGGPCPPKDSGVHHYSFKAYAINSQLELQEGATKSQIEKAMKDKIIEKAELIGIYEKK